MPDPRVSVIVPVRDREGYVGTAIESVLQQRFSDFELIVIDDGSSDRSREVVAAFAHDPRVRIEPNSRHLGIPATRNRGLSLARGAYVAMLDSDDWTAPERLGQQVAFLDRHPDHALVGAWTAGMDAAGRVQRRLRVEPVTPAEVRARLLFQCCPAQSTVMGRTAVLRTLGYREDHVVSSDFDLWLRVSRAHAIANLPAVMVRSRMHPERVTRQKADLVRATVKALVRAQLGALDVAFEPEDLDAHYLLPRARKHAIDVDRDLLERGAAWLARLLAANARSRRYDEHALLQEIGRVWLVAWWAAPPAVRARLVPRVAHAPLRRAVRAFLSRSATVWAASRRHLAERAV